MSERELATNGNNLNGQLRIISSFSNNSLLFMVNFGRGRVK